MDNQYFASLPTEEVVAELEQRVDDYYQNLQTNGLMALWAKSYDLYNSASTRAPEIKTTGENQQYKRINVNHYRNFIQHLMNLTISQRPAFEPRATNTDVKSQAQTILARGLLDYYMREKRLERNLRSAVEQCLVYGESFVTTTWNATIGEVYATDPDTGAERQAGDIEFGTIEPLNLIRDVHLESWADSQWVIIKRTANKYDLAAKYPEMAELILAVASDEDPRTSYRVTTDKIQTSSDLIEVYDFYHEKSDSMPNGRIVSYIDSEIVLIDGPLPYTGVPVFRVTPSDLTGSTQGYSPAFDLLALQDGVNDLYSTILTNQLTFGVQNVTIPIGCTATGSQLNGMNIITYNPAQGKPEPLNLTSTPVEIFNFLGQLEHTMEIISGVNSVARGNPESSLQSGAALALVQSMSIQFAQQLQQSYVQLLEDVGTSTINILRDYASVPRIAEIAGKHNRGIMKEFTGDDLAQVNRVTVDVGNPMTRTTAGKVELAQMMIQAGLVKTPDQLLQVIQTGNLDPLIEGKTTELLAIRSENESMAEGNSVMAMITDEHVLHILEHKAIVSDPAIRADAAVVTMVGNHIMEHHKFLSDPSLASLLTILGQQPIQSAPPAPMPQGNGDANNPMTMADNVQKMQPNMPNMPTNPLTGEKAPTPNQAIPGQA